MMQVQEGNTDALQQLHELYRHELYAFFCRLERDHHQAQDGLQEVFLRLWGARSRYRPTASFRTFVYTLARRYWLNRADRQRRSPIVARLGDDAQQSGRPDPRNDRADHRPGPADRVETDETLQRLQVALDRLPDPQRLAFVMAHYQGIRYVEIAEVMAVPVGTIKSRVAHATATLRQALADPKRAEA